MGNSIHINGKYFYKLHERQPWHTIAHLKLINMADSNNLKVTTLFDKHIYIGLAQYQHDMGLPYLQDANRILVAQSLKSLGYPKEVHPIKATTKVDS